MSTPHANTASELPAAVEASSACADVRAAIAAHVKARDLLREARAKARFSEACVASFDVDNAMTAYVKARNLLVDAIDVVGDALYDKAADVKTRYLLRAAARDGCVCLHPRKPDESV